MKRLTGSGSCLWVAAAALVVAAAIPMTAGAAERMVLGEYHNATW